MCKSLWSRYVVVAVIVILVTMLAACGGDKTPASGDDGGDTPVAVDGETLLQERCTQCHNVERTTNEQKTREQWEQSVTRMVEKGAKLTQDEQTVLIDYLAETYAP